MDPAHVLLLLGMGLAAGFVAGLIGLGGGVIFAPVLLLYFQNATGVDAVAVSKLTAGSSLFCTLIAALSSAWHQHREGAVLPAVAWRVGLFSALAVLATTHFVTTQPWYDAEVFRVVFGILLIVVVARMVGRRKPAAPDDAPSGWKPRQRRGPLLAGTGMGAGAIASAAGVGGGVVLVPAYHRFLRLPMERAVGTSSATIVIISLVGVASYMASGWGVAGLPPTATGYVDVGHAVLLAGPAVLSAKAGVWTAHHIRTQALRWSFAAVALLVAAQMFYDVLAP